MLLEGMFASPFLTKKVKFMGFKNHEHKKLPNQKDILECITDSQIFEFYLGGLPNRPISSPLRQDKVPSFSLFYSDKHQRIFFKDFATGDTGDCFVFVMRLLGYSKITDVFSRIADDFGLTQFETKKVHSRRILQSFVSDNNKTKDVKKDRVDIQVKVRPWKMKDKRYWFDKYGFTIAQLEHLGIYPISHYFLNSYCRSADDLAYAFIEEKDGLQTFKIYQPLNREWKWINNNDFSTWELWTQLPNKGKRLIITSSRKDAGVIKTLYPGELLTSCALQSEKTNAKESVVDELKLRFEKIYVLYDNDYDKEQNWGRIAGKKLCDEHGLIQLEIPETNGTKDISDFREKFGAEITKNLIKTMILKADKN
jgi:hypothetical protein